MDTLGNKNKANGIGVMDSGVGGLTVLKQLVQICPNENYLYFGDTKNLPYGEKKKEELIEIAKKIFDFYAEKKVKAVVMACNTTSATVYDELKDKYNFKIYPLIQIVSACLAQEKDIKKIAILATQATVNSHKYKIELQKHNPKLEIIEQACPQWVPMVEQKLKNYDKKTIITQYLNKVKDFNPDKIILGCTHYPYLLDELSKYIPKNKFINPAETFANYIKQDLTNTKMNNIEQIGNIEYFASSNAEEFRENSKLFFDIKTTPDIILI